jgi:hypothetical protein
MVVVPAFCGWLEQSPIGAAVRQSLWLFPAIETVHLLGMTVLVGTVAAFDLRLLCWGLQRTRVSDLARRLLPWTWVGFGLQVVTGALLFSSEAVKMYVNPAFRLKMLLICLAGMQALIFQLAARRNLAAWDERAAVPVAARIGGLISILLWIGVVAAGRWIGFI